MGQFALGIRSLFIKAAVFVIMAALLAWALGGTLWPRPARVQIFATGLNGKDLYWLLEARDGAKVIGPTAPSESVQWQLVSVNSNGKTVPLSYGAIDTWSDVAGPERHNGQLYFGGLVFNPSGSQWFLYTVDFTLNEHETTAKAVMPDRLAVEQQLARLAAGLPLQDAQTILQQRAAVLDPKANPADQH